MTCDNQVRSASNTMEPKIERPPVAVTITSALNLAFKSARNRSIDSSRRSTLSSNRSNVPSRPLVRSSKLSMPECYYFGTILDAAESPSSPRNPVISAKSGASADGTSIQRGE